MARHLPRLLLAAMLCSIIALGIAVKSKRGGAGYASGGFTGTTFDRTGEPVEDG